MLLFKLADSTHVSWDSSRIPLPLGCLQAKEIVRRYTPGTPAWGTEAAPAATSCQPLLRERQVRSSAREENHKMAPGRPCRPRAHARLPHALQPVTLHGALRCAEATRSPVCVTRCVRGRGLPCEAHLYGLRHDSSGSSRNWVTWATPWLCRLR